MPRKERLFIAGLPQLISLRGNNRETLFADEEDYRVFLQCLKRACGEFSPALHAFALLDTRILLLLSPPDKTSLARFIQHLGRCYVPYFNKKYQRSGALLEGRYHNCLIESPTYFLVCQKYLETQTGQNGDCRWNSYPLHAGVESVSFLTPHPAYLALAPDAATRAQRYRQFMATPLGSAFTLRIEECLQQNCVLGTLQFCRELEERIHHSVRPRHSGRPRKHYPNRLSYWSSLEQEAHDRFTGYAYREIRLSLLEQDTPDEALSPALRSEGTPGCLRAIAPRLNPDDITRVWYQGPMFRPQHLEHPGIEQFHQIGAEAFGEAGIEIELEQLLIQYDMIRQLKLAPLLELHLTTLGSPAELACYQEALRQYFSPFSIVLGEERRRLLVNRPEQLLVSPPEMLAELVHAAPTLQGYLSPASRERFETLTTALERARIPFTVTPRLFPERSCYSHTFYEWQTVHLEQRNVVCRGGRYDELAREIAGYPLPAAGFAFMVEPLVQLAENARVLRQEFAEKVDISILSDSTTNVPEAIRLGNLIRSRYPGLAVFNDFSGLRLQSRIARAKKRGSRFVITLHQDSQRPIDLCDFETDLRAQCREDEVVAQLKRWFN